MSAARNRASCPQRNQRAPEAKRGCTLAVPANRRLCALASIGFTITPRGRPPAHVVCLTWGER